MTAADSNSGIVLPAHRVRVFDPVEVFAQRVRARSIVYLDTNIWIELRDATGGDSARHRQSCLRAVSEGRVIFPVSLASVNEVLENPSPDARRRQADLMDSLSLGVTFRSPQLVHTLEGEAACRQILRGEAVPLQRHEVFTSLPDFLGTGYMNFPVGWRPADVEEFLAYYRTTCGSVRWLVDHGDLERIRKNHSGVDTYGQRMGVQRAAQRAQLGGGKIARETFAHDERIAQLKAYVLPAMQRAVFANVGPEDPVAFAHRFREAHRSRRRLREIFRAVAPGLEILAQIFAAQSLDRRRKTRRNDFWDVEHASVAPVYADVFVTADRALAEVLRLGDWRPPAAKATLLTSVDELGAWLDAPVSREAQVRIPTES